MLKHFRQNVQKLRKKGFQKNPFFWFGTTSFVLLGVLFFSSGGLAQANYQSGDDVVFFNSFFKNTENLTSSDVFLSQNKELVLQTPDLKIIQDNSIGAVATPSVLTTQTLGNIFGGQDTQRKDVSEYQVQVGDTVQSVADSFGITPATVLAANNLSKNTTLKVGQTLVILPVSGVSYIVKNGDTLSQVAKVYKANLDDIVAYNNLANQGDIFIGDSLIIPGGVVPPKSAPSITINVPLADNFFIFPAEGIITQGLHYYNGVDLANKCGSSIYASASGTVQRAVSGGKWNLGMGNYVTILHSNGTVTYYGHLQTLLVKSGSRVDVGDRIGLMGQTGNSTGCHVHFQVIGASNPLGKYKVGSKIKY